MLPKYPINKRPLTNKSALRTPASTNRRITTSNYSSDSSDDGSDVLGAIVTAEIISSALDSSSSYDSGSSSDSYGGFDDGGGSFDGGGASGDW